MMITNRYRNGAVLKATVSLSAMLGVMLPLAQTAHAQEDAVTEDATENLTLDTVTVTSRFREESIQDIGASVAALSGDQLSDESLQDFDELASRIVGLDSIDRGPNQNDVSLRGVSNNTISSTADSGRFSPLVSQYFDDVPVSAATGSQKDFNLFDMDRVEILRGPQPTLFGEGAVGGAIRYFSRNPDLDGEGLNDLVLEAGLSQIDEGDLGYSLSGAGSLTLVPGQLAVRGVLNYREDGGFIDYTAAGEDNANSYESVSGRVVVLAEPNENLSIRLMAMIGDDESSGGNTVSVGIDPDELEAVLPFAGLTTDEYELFAGTVDYDFGPVTVTSVTSVYNRDYAGLAASEALAQLFSIAATGFSTTQFPETSAQFSTNDELFSQELRFVSDLDGPFNFTAGLNYQEVTSEFQLGIVAPGFADFALAQDPTLPGFVPGGLFAFPGGLFANPAEARDELISGANKFETEQISAFAEVTLDVSERLRLIGGARYVREEITSTFVSEASILGTVMGLFPPFIVFEAGDIVDLVGVEREQTFTLDKVLPKGSIEFDLTDGTLLYGTVATGARNGNTNLLSNVISTTGGDPVSTAQLIDFDEDNITSYEVGAKSVLLDGRLILNAAAFTSEFEDPQVTVIPAGSNLTVNGPDIDIMGVELESLLKVNDIWTTYLNVSYQDAEFTDNASIIDPNVYINNFLLAGGDPALVPTLLPIASNDLAEGNKPINVPEWSLAAGANFSKPLSRWDANLTGGFSYQFIDSRFGSVGNYPATELEALNLLNVNLGLESEKWALQAFVKNLTNEVEFSSVIGVESQTGIISANGQLDLTPTDASVNTPRTIGLKLTLRH